MKAAFDDASLLPVEGGGIFRRNDFDVAVMHKIDKTQFVAVPHLHCQYEIYYNVEGAKCFLIESEFYECRPHDLFIIPKAHIHKMVADKNTPYERVVINIADEIISSVNALPHMGGCLTWFDDAGRSVPRKVNLSEDAHALFMMHVREYRRLEMSHNELLLYSKLFEILAFVCERFRTSSSCSETATPESWSDKALGYIEKNFRTITVADIAHALYINEDYLNKIFKSETGITLNNYIIFRRIAEAKKILYQGGSVKESCIGSGFNDYANFIRTFKKIEGVPPGAFEILDEPL